MPIFATSFKPRASRAYGVLLLCGLTAPLSVAGCLSDVPIPACLEDTSCTSEGGANDGGAAPIPAAGTTSTAGTTSVAGTAGTTPVLPDGGASGQAGGETSAGSGGEGGDGNEPECSDCRITPERLSPSCEGAAYDTPVAVIGGVAPFRWQATSTLPGWSITPDPANARQATLKQAKVAADSAELTIKVTDATGAAQSAHFTLAPRKSCWFAFTALGEQGPELRLLDPFTRPPTPAVLANNHDVYDFKFAPDGKHIAYRFGATAASPRGAHLALVELATLDERVLTFAEDRVDAYAWSPDSSTLAVAFTAGTSTYLTPVSTGAKGTLSVPSPTPAFVESELYWVGNRFVAYHAALLPDFAHPGQFLPNPGGFRTAFYAELGANAFGPQAMAPDSFPPNVVLQPTDEGFFMVASGDPYTIFTPLTGDQQAVLHFGISLISPSGRYTALLDGSPTLQVLPADLGYFSPIATAAQGDDCPMPLGWSKGAERIACLADVPNQNGATTHGEVRFFDLKESSDVLEMTTLAGFCNDDVSTVTAASCTTLNQGYGYGTAEATGAARAFSPSGRWFAFVSAFEDGTFLYTADLDAHPIQIKATRYFSNAGAVGVSTRLVFSPDDHLLLFQRGSTLTLVDPATGFGRENLSKNLATFAKCTDDFAANPDSFCANTERLAELPWASNSREFAYRTPGALTVVDATNIDIFVTRPLAALECGVRCSGQAAFQP